MSRTGLSVDAKTSGRQQKRPDLLDLLSSGEPPAFANDENHRIIFWNRGAERLLERSAAQALGRLCHEVMCGRDPFGNRFCGENCTVSTTLRKHETLNRFEITTGDRSRAKTVGVTVIEIPDSRPGCFTAIHIMDQVDVNGRLARELSRLRETLASSVPPSPFPEGGAPIALQTSRRGAARTSAPDPAAPGPLSERELEVLRAIASGQANKDIATALNISVATTRNHVQRILKKLNVHSKLEAVALAFRNGWTSG